MGSGWWVADLLHNHPALLVSWVFWVIFSICLHELAHGWAALRHGDRTPIESGHMTWNPLVHMGPMSLIAFAAVGIAWGAMPVNPSRMRGRYADAAVAAAGPAMNLGLAGACVLAGGAWAGLAGGVADHVYDNVLTFFHAGAFLNLVLMMFNLLPVPPLDGSKILADFSPGYRRLTEHPQFQAAGIFIFLGIFFFAGRWLWGPATAAADYGIAAVAMLFM